MTNACIINIPNEMLHNIDVKHVKTFDSYQHDDTWKLVGLFQSTILQSYSNYVQNVTNTIVLTECIQFDFDCICTNTPIDDTPNHLRTSRCYYSMTSGIPHVGDWQIKRIQVFQNGSGKPGRNRAQLKRTRRSTRLYNRDIKAVWKQLEVGWNYPTAFQVYGIYTEHMCSFAPTISIQSKRFLYRSSRVAPKEIPLQPQAYTKSQGSKEKTLALNTPYFQDMEKSFIDNFGTKMSAAMPKDFYINTFVGGWAHTPTSIYKFYTDSLQIVVFQ